jgi:amidohydrolase
MLLELKREFSGRVRLLFQPSEENSTGAKAMIADGAMDGVDGVFGLHVWSELDAGKISVEAGPRMASADFWRMEVRGRGGHGAMPHNTVDALIAGAAIVNSLQSVASREISPLEPVVLSIGEFRAGTLPNIIAETAYLSGTTRTFNADIREKLPGILRRIAENTAAAYRAGISLDYDFGSPVVENDPACSALAGAAVRKVLGEGALALLEKTLSGEDFAEYQRLAPGVFCFVGIRNPEIGAIHPQHSPRYAIDESVLAGAAAFTSQYALDFLGRE